jgi:hypothetical protein
VKLSDWARQQGVSYQTAWRWVKDGKMPVPVRPAPSGTWLVDEPPVGASGRVVVYCRVSSAEQEADLERQTARVVSGTHGLGLAVAEVVTEVGSGLNGRRRKRHRLLSDPQAFRFALDPNAVQEPALRSHCGAARAAYNWAVGWVEASWRQRRAEESYGVPEAELTEWRP